MEVNSLLLGSGCNKRRSTGEHKELRALRLGGNKDEKKSEESIPLKVWKILTPETKIAMRSGEEVKIGLVKDSGANEVKHGDKKSCCKFLRLNQSKGKKNEASLMKSVDEFITRCGGPF